MIIKISSSEKLYILQGIKHNIRANGRQRLDYRPISIETDVLIQSNGSARVSMDSDSTDVLVSVKVELGVPSPSKPNSGRIEINAECSPSVSAKLEGRVAEEINTELTELLNRLICSSPNLDLESLCIIPGTSVWILKIDVMVFDSGGNLPDIISLAVYAALKTTCIPKTSLIGDDQKEIEVVSDTAIGTLFDASTVPLCVTLSYIGSSFITDATLEEELCVGAQLSIAVDVEGNICGVQKSRTGSIRSKEMESMIDAARKTSTTLFQAVEIAIQSQLERDTATFGVEKVGFLS